MANIFKKAQGVDNHPTRNNHDLSHKRHISGKIGEQQIIFCRPTWPGETFDIDMALGLQLAPMPYPTQSNLRVVVHFFAGRNKNVWPNWENYVQGLEQHELPYIDQPASFYRTGGIADQLGIPTTFVSAHDTIVDFDADGLPAVGGPSLPPFPWLFFGYDSHLTTCVEAMSSIPSVGQTISTRDLWLPVNNFPIGLLNNYNGLESIKILQYQIPSAINTIDLSSRAEHTYLHYRFGMNTENRKKFRSRLLFVSSPDANTRIGKIVGDLELNVFQIDSETTGANLYQFSCSNSDALVLIQKMKDFEKENGPIEYLNVFFNPFLALQYQYSELDHSDLSAGFSTTPLPYKTYLSSDLLWTCFNNRDVFAGFKFSGQTNIPKGTLCNISDFPSLSPYFCSSDTQSNDDRVKVNALPFRHYEAAFNYFYRNTHGVQPFKIDGVTKYNRYNTNLEDGADTTNYHLFNQNWELDAYTSCLPSPMQGNVPIIAVNSTGNVVVQDEDGNRSTLQLHDLENGEQGVSFDRMDAQTSEHARMLLQLASTGMTINDFRQGNALTRFLETNMRKGFRYIDFIAGHFGVKLKNQNYDLPEFIGGWTQRIDVNSISNTNQAATVVDDDAVLGNIAGQARAFGSAPHHIRHYCDDFGYIFAVMTVIPDVAYSQILPKHFIYREPLDYAFPEFTQLGMQGVTYAEVSPIQSHIQNIRDPNIKLTDVFGYQRPNWDLIHQPDTLHGQFRTTLTNFVISRQFAERPELSEAFIAINPDEVNNIFSFTRFDNDVYWGQVAFKVTAKTFIPRVSIPSLGR